jgi:hypothetical protein
MKLNIELSKLHLDAMEMLQGTWLSGKLGNRDGGPSQWRESRVR